MTRSILFCVFALAACGDNLTVPDNDAGTSIPHPPTADGEYAISVAQDSFVCDGQTSQIPTQYEVADVIAQDDPWKFDLLNRPAHELIQWDDYYRYNLTWDNTGFFENRHFDPVFLGAESDKFIVGSVDNRSLYFFHRFDLGYHDDSGKWNSLCVYEAEANGVRRYAPWDGSPRASIDGEWRVKKTITASPLIYPTSLPYTHFVTMDTVAQNDGGSIFNLAEAYNPLFGVIREPGTGKVDALMIDLYPVVTNGQTQTTVYETKLRGTLLPDSMDLEFTWKWYTAETGQVYWFQDEHYQGVPRYNAHNSKLPEPPTGVYKTAYQLMPNDCGYAPSTEQRLLDVLPADDGVWLHMTDLNIEPIAKIGSDNYTSFTFDRQLENGTTYTYWVDGTIDGHDLNLDMDITATDPAGQYKCAATYKITGEKRFESYR